MKIILSRKGFDSTAGGSPSPIINNKIFSVPIPDSKDDIRYSDLIFNQDKTYYDIMVELGIRSIKKEAKCHLDPDLDIHTLKYRPKGWKPLFGQAGSSQIHLENQGVGVGDLFLFFGWFRRTENRNGKLKYVGPDFHMIFGYLQVGKIIKIANNDPIENWMKYHPHIKRMDRKNDKTNTVYVASDKLPFIEIGKSGGVLNFSEDLILTKKNHPKSQWQLPGFFHNFSISYHPNPWRENYFQSTGRGQEFVIEEDREVESWAKNLILNNIAES